MNENLQQFKDLKETRATLENLEQEKKDLEAKSAEVSPDQLKEKMSVVELEILQTRGQLLKLEENLGLKSDDPGVKEVEDAAFKEIDELEQDTQKIKGVIAAESPEEKISREDTEAVISATASFVKKIQDGGYTFEQFGDLKYSEDENEKAFYDETVASFDTPELNERFDRASKQDPNLLIDSIHKIPGSGGKGILLESLVDNKKISPRKLSENLHRNFNRNDKIYDSLSDKLTSRILQEKKEALKNLPVEEVFVLLESDNSLFDNEQIRFQGERVKALILLYLEAGNISEVRSFASRVFSLQEKICKNLSYSFLPQVIPGMDFNSETTLKIFQGEMSQDIFNAYESFIVKSPFLKLVPEACFKGREIEKSLRLLSGEVSKQQIQEVLASLAVDFDSLDPQIKKIIFRLNLESDVFELFTPEDFKQIMRNQYVDYEKVPESIRPFLVSDLFFNFIDQYAYPKYEDLVRLQKGLNIEFSDLEYSHKRYIFTNFYKDERMYSLFSEEDIKDFFRSFEISISFIPPSIREKVFSESFSNNQARQELQRGSYEFIKDSKLREGVFTLATEEIQGIPDDAENTSWKQSMATRISNIGESFNILDSKEKLSPAITQKINEFTERYGGKGESLVSLAITAHGKEESVLLPKLEAIQQVLNLYQPENIPDGAHVSMGIEYEVTRSLSDEYDKQSHLGYKRDIELVSRSSKIAQGLGGVHEVATKPTSNPYMLIAEVKLLQDAGFLDFNFTEYQDAPRGYHMSYGGESGIFVGTDQYFIQNAMTLAGTAGIVAGKDVSYTKDIHAKNLENVFGTSKGARVEMKGMATDSFEQFERAVITTHNAGIAMQLSNKFLDSHISIEDVRNSLTNSEEFEKALIENGKLITTFTTQQERDIVYEWFKLKQRMFDAVNQHNDSFIDSEFRGFRLDSEGNYQDTGTHIDVARNLKLVEGKDLNSEEFKKEFEINPTDLFQSQSVGFVNALTHTNNIFLKGPQTKEINSSINAGSVINTMRAPGYGNIDSGSPKDSIFDRGGEMRDGYYVVQGASEEMISHKSQILLNNFNKRMQELLSKSKKEELVNA